MLPAQFVRNFLYLLKIGFHIAAQLLSVQKGHRIDCYVVMQVVLIQMRTDDHLEPLTEQPFGKLHADGMGLLGGNLAWLKRLDNVIALYTAGLVVAPFGALHIPGGVFNTFTVQTAFKQPFLGFIRVDGVFNHAGKSGLFLVSGILNGFLKPAVYGEHFGDRHIRTP